jgi:hypothetical protein
VEAEHGVAAAAQKVVGRIATPAHRHARLVADGLSQQAPHIAPDIYPHLVVRLTGRMKRPAPGATLEIVCDDGTIAVVPISVSRDSSITTRWASQRIKALDADVMAERDRAKVSKLEKLITELSIRHSVLSKYTAWLAVDRSRTTDSVVVRTLVQPDHALGSDVSVGMGAMSVGHTWHYRPAIARAASRARWSDLAVFSSISVDYDAYEDSSSDVDTTGLPALVGEREALLSRLRVWRFFANLDKYGFANTKRDILRLLDLLPATRQIDRLLNAILRKRIAKLLSHCESALEDGDDDKAWGYLAQATELLASRSETGANGTP